MRRAVTADVPVIVALLADDTIGSGREEPEDIDRYVAAFQSIDEDPSELLAVAEIDDEVAGTLQLSFLPGLSRGAATRLQIEAVRVAADHRGSGLGGRMIGWAIAEGRRRGCALAQLTSDIRRDDAQRFYEDLGFEPSHVGYKLSLDGPTPLDPPRR